MKQSSRSSSAAPARRSVSGLAASQPAQAAARQGRREVGRRHVQEDDARRQGRAAGRLGRRLDVPGQRHRRVRRARAEGHATSSSAASTCSAARSRRRRCCSTTTTAPSSSASRSRPRRSLNRLQALSAIPLLNTADFEAGVGLPHSAAPRCFRARWPFGAAGDERWRSKRRRSRRIEVARDRRARQLLAARRREQQPAQSRHQHAVVRRGARSRSARSRRPTCAACTPAACSRRSSTFPGHGDTDVDSHLGLPIINQPRERLDRDRAGAVSRGHRRRAPTR